jgi:hypothetical protein
MTMPTTEGAEPNQVAPQPQKASAPKPPLWLRIVRNPLSRLILFFALLLLFSSAIRWAFPLPALETSQALKLTGPPLWLRALCSLMPPVLAYWVLVRLIERRPIEELSAKKAIPHSVIGWLIGMAIMLSSAAAMWLVGVLDFHGVNSGVSLLAPLLVLAVVPGIAEEIIVRGVLFRVVEDGLGTWIALAISAAIFGFGHYANPNADAWSSVAIAIEAGLLLGMAYAWTRSLWFVAGLHAAWNFTQGALLGIPVSGMAVKGWAQTTVQGPNLLSGGQFGAEASLLAVLVCIAFAAYFTRKAIVAGKIVTPFWRRVPPVGLAVPKMA